MSIDSNKDSTKDTVGKSDLVPEKLSPPSVDSTPSPSSLKRLDYNYDLPEHRIAFQPLAERDQSKMLVYRCEDDSLSDASVRELASYIPRDCLMVLNSSKVIPARLRFRKATGAQVEIFLLEPSSPAEYQSALSSTGSCRWRCLIGGKNLRVGTELQQDTEQRSLSAIVLTRDENRAEIEFRWQAACSFAEMLEDTGSSPLPPYIRRDAVLADRERYQTIFAKQSGSVAAPTAALHLSEKLLQELNDNNVQRTELCLHVGLGTFQPMKSDSIAEHQMHAEFISVPIQCLRDIREQLKKAQSIELHDETSSLIDESAATTAIMPSQSDKKSRASRAFPILCVGTTSLRSIESLYWLSCLLREIESSAIVELSQGSNNRSKSDLSNDVLADATAGDNLVGATKLSSETELTAVRKERGADFASDSLYPLVEQWSWQRLVVEYADWSAEQSIEFLLQYCEQHGFDELRFRSQLMICPGYPFKFCNILMTNFHQPESTLLVLVSAFVGDEARRRVYAHALDSNYRFLSYGDSSLLFR